ncbi:MAG: protein kinase [Deltaproteobacteria bacterium]|nr:protein kinase [Deltaproteobacteria bacterium]MDQ3296150.1 protein kinase [Myxococcota bacterium]
MADDEIGSTANKYEIVAKLATGGMAEIYLARNESTAGVERYVVLKRVLRHHANDIKFVNMFLDEARLSARLQHPNIAQVYDTGKLGDSYFFTMEYVHGETVRDILHETYAAKQQVPVAVALTIIAGAAAGLQHAHERVGFDGHPLCIVHRDVSPSNLMVSHEGNVKLVDFGVAKATHRAHETQTGAVKGKVGYMSPEQIRSADVDARSDLFSLGIVMWELLAGDRLFKRAADFETMEAIIGEPAPPPSTRRADLGPEIDAIVCKLLEKSPALRFQTANELLEALDVATVRAGLSLSVSGVRRFMRDLFGVRVEPWVELTRGDAHTDVITITGQLDDPHDPDMLSAQLDHLLDLSTVSSGTAPPLSDDEQSYDEPEAENLWQRNRVRAAAARSATSPTVADALRTPTVPSPPPATPPVSVPVPVPPATVSAAPSMSRLVPQAPASSPRLADTETVPRPWFSPVRLIVGVGIAACVVLVVVLARNDGGDEPSGRTRGVDPMAAPAKITEPVRSPAATVEPRQVDRPAAQPVADVPVDGDVEIDVAAPDVPATPPASTRENPDRASQRERATPPRAAVRSTTSKRGGSRSTGEDTKTGGAPGPQRDSVPAAPEPSAKVKPRCDDSDPLACRR